jgi:hypothetical protein
VNLIIAGLIFFIGIVVLPMFMGYLAAGAWSGFFAGLIYAVMKDIQKWTKE